jgi:hypothetical protein
VILLKNYETVLVEGEFCTDEEIDGVFVGEVGEDPLDPDYVVFLGEGEVLQALAVEVAGGGGPQDLSCLLDVLLALIDDVNLASKITYIPKIPTKQLLGDPTNPSPTINNIAHPNFRKFPNNFLQKDLTALNINLT